MSAYTAERRPRIKEVLPRRKDRLQLYGMAVVSIVKQSFNGLADSAAGSSHQPKPDTKIEAWILERANPSSAAAVEYLDDLKDKVDTGE